MRAALVAGERMKFIDDDMTHGGELLAELRRGQQDEQRLRSGDKNVRRTTEHRGTLARRSVAGAESSANVREIELRLGAGFAHAIQRLLEVEADIVRERLERRDIEH